jgi:hypothetical protein
MQGIKITSLTIRDFEPGDNGARVLAHFDTELLDGALAVRGCSFVKTPKAGFTVWPPRAEANPVKSSVQIKGSALQAAMMAAARDAYRAMGGTEAEWSPRSQDGGTA